MRTLVLALALATAAPAMAQAPDPGRMALAERIAAAQIPPGSLRTMMDAAMGNVTQGFARQFANLPVRGFAAAAGMNAADVERLGPGTLAEAMAILDPAFQQRTERMMKIMIESMVPLVAEMEPGYRRAYAEAYARRYDARTLTAVDAFYRTPEGAAFAASQMAAASDPAVLAAARDLQPKLLAALPAIMGRVNEATADLPKPRKYADLTPAERAKLADLFGRKDAK